MNKLLTKIVGIALGATMAIGVGVAIASNRGTQKVDATVGSAVTIGSHSYVSAYETGFENATTSTTYNSTVNIPASGTKHGDGASWTIYYGTVSTGSPISGSNSLQMRWYSSAKNNLPYAKTTSSISNVKAFKFDYQAGNTNWKFDVDYSSDGTNWTTKATVTPSDTSSHTLSYELDSAVENFYFRIATSSSATKPSSGTWQFRLDSIVFGSPLVPVTGVSIKDGNSHEVAVGETLDLDAIVTPDDATNKTITWSLSNLSPAGCATINSSTGVVTGVAAGAGKVTVTTADGSFTDTDDLTVTNFVAVTSVELNKSSTSLYVGDTETLTATVSPDDASNKNVTWTSTDATVASVEDGVVTALKAGSATITATSASDGSKKDTCTVTVNNRAVTGISLNKSETSIVKGGTETLVATISPNNATIKTITWETSDSNKATVSDGVVTAVAQGEAVISAKANGYVSDVATPDLIAKCTVTVTDVVTTGHKYVLISEYVDNSQVTHKEVFNGMYYYNSGTKETAYGTYADYHNFPTTSYQIEIVTGNQSGTYGLKLSNNKYLGYSSTYGNNSLHEFDTLGNSQSWNISVSAGNYVISLYGAATRTIQFNGNSGQERFSTYTSSQKAVKLVEVNDETIVGNFIETKMHLHDYDSELHVGVEGDGDCKGNGKDYYGKNTETGAKYAFNHLSSTQRATFMDENNTQFANARARLIAWATANGETIGTDNESNTNVLVANSNKTIIAVGNKNISSNSVALIIVVISSIGLSAVGGFFFLRKRKEVK